MSEPTLRLEIQQESLRCEALDYHNSPCGKDAQHICADCFEAVCIGCSEPCYDCGEHLHPGYCRDFHAGATGHSVDIPMPAALVQLIDREVRRVCKIVDSAAVLGLFLLFVASLSFGQTIQHGVQLSCTQSGTATATFSFYRATTSHAQAKPSLVSGLTTCSYFDTSTVAGTTYYYTVTETVGGVESGPSTEVFAQTLVPPNPPTNPSATIQ